MQERWVCVRQRAGPLVKECRALRPRLSRYDTPEERKQKEKIIKRYYDSSVCRSITDRVELRLALFGFEGIHYTLTFDVFNLPAKFRDVRRAWRRFFARLRRKHGKGFDYLYAIEGLHGDRRYHIHAVLRASDFAQKVVDETWGYGTVHWEPVLRGKGDSYYRLARYFTKERSDGIIIPIDGRPCVWSQSLNHQLPPAERWESWDGRIDVPADPYWCTKDPDRSYRNEFGEYYFASYIKQWRAA